MDAGLIAQVFNFFMEIDKNILIMISTYGIFIYPLLFLIIFLETGIVITPFLPGDSLIFAVGAAAGAGALNIIILFIILCSAAILGDSVNYYIGKYFGDNILRKGLIKLEYIHKTRDFYEKHGGKTIILARFIPIVRTFAPFIAGIGKMKYGSFLMYNVIGGILWVSLFLFLGYFSGNLPFVKEHFAFVIFIIIALSIVPVIYEYTIRKLKRR